MTKRHLILLACLLLCCAVSQSRAPRRVAAQRAADHTPPGVAITAESVGTFTDDYGNELTARSELLRILILPVPALEITPRDEAPSGRVRPRETFSRTFRVCNSGNVPLTTTVTSASASEPARLLALHLDADDDGSAGTSDPELSAGSALPSPLEPSACASVLALADAGAAPPSSTVSLTLTASGSAPGVESPEAATGLSVSRVSYGARLADPTDTSLAPSLLANGLTRAHAAPGEDVTFSLRLLNAGDETAHELSLIDELGPGFNYTPGTLTLDGRAVTDAADDDEASAAAGRVSFRLAELPAGQPVAVSFRARLDPVAEPARAYLSTMSVEASDAAATRATATVIANSFGAVYSLRSGVHTPVGGATLTLTPAPDSTSPLPMPASEGQGPNPDNANPFTAPRDGTYAFTPPAAQSTLYLRAEAAGYRTRLFRISTTSAPNDTFRAEVVAEDGLPVAHDATSLTLEDAAAISFDIPMLEARDLELTMRPDRQAASVGDLITYAVTVHNPTAVALSDVVVANSLPQSFNYAPGTARISGQPAAPAQPAEIAARPSGRTLELRAGSLPAGATATLIFRVAVGADCRPGLRRSEATADATYPNGDHSRSQPARADVFISAGIFGMTQAIVGRVYADNDDDGRFTAADAPLEGARLYLPGGEYAVTDAEGLYNFPLVDGGPTLVTLDPSSLPQGYAPSHRRDWSALLRTPLSGGTLLVQDFPTTAPAPLSPPAAAATPARADEPHNASARPQPPRPQQPTQPKPQPGQVIIAERGGSQPQNTLPLLTLAGWQTRLELNGQTISENKIGETRTDHAAGTVTYTYAGLGLRPGPNRVRAWAVDAAGTRGPVAEATLMGRGPAERLIVTTDKTELSSGGRDQITITVRALDHWGGPALDAAVTLESADLQIITPGKDVAPDTRPGRRAAKGTTARATTSNGEAQFTARALGTPGAARLSASATGVESEAEVTVTPDGGQNFFTGLAEFTFGRSPEAAARGDVSTAGGRLRLFYQGTPFGRNHVTLAYDSERQLNRRGGTDRLFELDPLDRLYPLFGDTSSRFESAPSNSKLYLRVDRGRSSFTFGDLNPPSDSVTLAGYAVKQTGARLRLGNASGDSVTLTGAAAPTAYARDLLPGGAASADLSHADVIPGSEVLSLEVRDRRNPELLVSRETLSRSIDYNLDASSGRVTFLRYVPAFDISLNPVQVVAAYQYRSDSPRAFTFTARAVKSVKPFGLRLGLSYARQGQGDRDPFQLMGLDAEKTTPGGGLLNFEAARSSGAAPFRVGAVQGDARGYALKATYRQPLPWMSSELEAAYAQASEDFLNPFAATTTAAGARRVTLRLALKPRETSTLQATLADEGNQTVNVSNRRKTASLLWTESLTSRLRLQLGYDLRDTADYKSGRDVTSHLVTAGAEWQPTDRLQLSLRREQNLGDADPSYPTQTLISAAYRLDQQSRLFFTQRISSSPIIPLADTSGTSASSPSSRGEWAAGFETRLRQNTSVTARYEIQHGEDARDQFAVIGLQHRVPAGKDFRLDFGYERGFHVSGPRGSFDHASAGVTWEPGDRFIANLRYELSGRDGLSHTLAAVAAGRLNDSWSALARFQFEAGRRDGTVTSARASRLAFAWRPSSDDRKAFLFSYDGRGSDATAQGGARATSSEDQLSADFYLRPYDRLELYTRAAGRAVSSDSHDLPAASLLTLLLQARAQYRVNDAFDFASELRTAYQFGAPVGRRDSAGAEVGFWPAPSIRLAVGYNVSLARDPGPRVGARAGGFYFNVSTKLSGIFDLFKPRDRARAGGPADR